jgi:hypothetical protein
VAGDVPLLLGDVGDFGRFMKSSFCRMKPLLLDLIGDLSSLMGDDLSSFSRAADDADDDDDDDDEDVDRSDEGFLRHTSRCRSIEPGNVRGGTRFCGSGPG